MCFGPILKCSPWLSSVWAQSGNVSYICAHVRELHKHSQVCVCECVWECESVRVIFSRQEWGTWRAQSSGLPQVWPDRRCCWRRSVSVWERNISWHVVCAAVCLFLGKMNVTSTVQPSSLMWAVEKKNKKILFLFFNISFTFAAGTFSKLYVDTFSAFASLNFETL